MKIQLLHAVIQFSYVECITIQSKLVTALFILKIYFCIKKRIFDIICFVLYYKIMILNNLINHNICAKKGEMISRTQYQYFKILHDLH